MSHPTPGPAGTSTEPQVEAGADPAWCPSVSADEHPESGMGKGIPWFFPALLGILCQPGFGVVSSANGTWVGLTKVTFFWECFSDVSISVASNQPDPSWPFFSSREGLGREITPSHQSIPSQPSISLTLLPFSCPGGSFPPCPSVILVSLSLPIHHQAVTPRAATPHRDHPSKPR